MMKKRLFSLILIVLVLFIILLDLPSVSVKCEEDMIDINTALEEELTQIKHIGPSRAAQIISLRPFESIDDLINVSGIGEIYLKNIKNQGLACVNNGEGSNGKDELDNNNVDNEDENILDNDNGGGGMEEESEIIIPKTSEVIKLTAKTIKSENSKEEEGNANYAIYGLVGLCILIIALLLLRRKEKSEFE